MGEQRVVVFDKRIDDLSIEREILGDLDVELSLSTADTVEGVVADARDAVAIIVDAGIPVPESVIETLSNLEIVARSGIGFDNVDTEAARRNGVRVTNVPDYCLDEVSTHALSLVLALARKLHRFDPATTAGRWNWDDGGTIERLSDRTLGIVGHGNIGSRMAEKAAPLFDRVSAYDPYVPDEDLRSAGVVPVSLEELYSASDVVSLHPPLTEETRGMVDASALELMSDGTILVNTSRGGVIDQDALWDALETGRIAAAGLDVLETEPPEDDALLSRDDVIVTPHAGWYSEQSMRELRESAAREVARTLEGKPPNNPVEEQVWL